MSCPRVCATASDLLVPSRHAGRVFTINLKCLFSLSKKRKGHAAGCPRAARERASESVCAPLLLLLPTRHLSLFLTVRTGVPWTPCRARRRRLSRRSLAPLLLVRARDQGGNHETQPDPGTLTPFSWRRGDRAPSRLLHLSPACAPSPSHRNARCLTLSFHPFLCGPAAWTASSLAPIACPNEHVFKDQRLVVLLIEAPDRKSVV